MDVNKTKSKHSIYMTIKTAVVFNNYLLAVSELGWAGHKKY